MNRFFFEVEVLFWLAVYRGLICFIPYRFWKHRWGIFQAETLKIDRAVYRPLFNRVKRVIMRVSRYTPWETKCLDRALCAQHILFAQGLSSTLYVGMMLKESGWIAHAWLRCGSEWIVGYEQNQDYGVVSSYAKV